MSSAKQSPFGKYGHDIQVSAAVVSVTSQPEGRSEALPLAETNSQNKPGKRAGKTNHTNNWKSIPHQTKLENNPTSLWPKNPLGNECSGKRSEDRSLRFRGKRPGVAHGEADLEQFGHT